MKKILVYVDSMKPAGGIERVIANLSNHWVRKYKVVILVKDKMETFYKLDENVQIKTIDKPLKLNMNNRFSRIITLLKSIWVSRIRLKKTLDLESPNIIYTASPVNSLEVCLAGKRYSNRLIISEHGSKLGYNKVYNTIKKYVYPRAYKISVPTKLDTELYRRESFPAVYIPHISTFKAENQNNLDSNIVLNIGRLTSDKNQIELLNVWYNLLKEIKLENWKLIIIGKGEEQERLSDFIEKHNMKDTVEILPPTPNINERFKQASIFAFTSRYEGFGMVLLEAMSFGIPCVAYDCPSGPRDLINDGVNGYLVENNNIDEFIMKLKTLVENKTGNRNKMGESAYQTVKEWDNDKILREWDELFSEL